MYLDLNSWEPKGQKNTNHKIDVGYLFFFGGGGGMRELLGLCVARLLSRKNPLFS